MSEQPTQSTSAVAAPAADRTGRLAAVVSLLVVVAAPFVYMATMRNAYLRSSGVLMFLMMGLGCGAGLAAARRVRRKWTTGIAVVNLLLTGFLAYGFFVLAKLPAVAGPDEAAAVADFTLPDHAGRHVTLYEELEKGPVMLIFYRGAW